MKVGLLALPGAIDPHADAFASFSVDTLEVGTPAQLVDVDVLDQSFHAVLIRAPFAESTGPEVEALSRVHGHGVLCRKGPVLVSASHPDLTADARLHRLFLNHI